MFIKPFIITIGKNIISTNGIQFYFLSNLAILFIHHEMQKLSKADISLYLKFGQDYRLGVEVYTANKAHDLCVLFKGSKAR